MRQSLSFFHATLACSMEAGQRTPNQHHRAIANTQSRTRSNTCGLATTPTTMLRRQAARSAPGVQQGAVQIKNHQLRQLPAKQDSTSTATGPARRSNAIDSPAL